MEDDRSAVLVIRVWQECGSEGFRARLSSVPTSPNRDGEQTLAVASSREAVLDAVRSWLDEVGADAPTDDR